MIYPPPQRQSSRGKAPIRELAIWVVGMSALAAALLVVGDVSPPFAPAVSATDTPAATEDRPVPTAQVLRGRSSGGSPAATATADLGVPDEFPGFPPASQAVPTFGMPVAAPTYAPPDYFTQPTAPALSGPMMGRPLGSATRSTETPLAESPFVTATPSLPPFGVGYP